MLFLIDYECAHWCGGSSHCVVEAANADDAVMIASDHMQEEMYELYSDEYAEDAEEGDSYNDESAFVVNSVETFDENHEYWKYYTDETQSQFFPKVN